MANGLAKRCPDSRGAGFGHGLWWLSKYEIGVARYWELARGQILGDAHGILKLLVSAQDRTPLGVHTFGTNATEVIHIGQAVMAHGGTTDYLVDAVFNYPTLAEGYKVAALDATNKRRCSRTKTPPQRRTGKPPERPSRLRRRRPRAVAPVGGQPRRSQRAQTNDLRGTPC